MAEDKPLFDHQAAVFHEAVAGPGRKEAEIHSLAHGGEDPLALDPELGPGEHHTAHDQRELLPSAPTLRCFGDNARSRNGKFQRSSKSLGMNRQKTY